MGAPKQRWTSEEEAALRAGISKYGVGKWSTILKDPEFTAVLRSRSNVDLKDKWRNMNCMASGLGSRNKASATHKNSQLAPKHDEGTTADNLVIEKDPVVVDAKPLEQVKETVQDASFRNQISRVDDLILEAIAKLKEPRGSSLRTIAEYIEDHYSAPPDMEKIVAANLKVLTEKGRLFKVKHQYRIAPRSISFDGAEVPPPLLLANGPKKGLSRVQRNGISIPTKAEIDAELEKMKGMSAEEAAAAAARAVAEAEAAIAAAEAATVEAEEAEVEAEAARCFLDAAQKSLSSISIRSVKSNR